MHNLILALIIFAQLCQCLVKLRNAERFIPAVTRRPQTSFKVGDQAFIIAYRGGIAEVVSKKEFDFITYKGRGGSS